MPCVAPSEIIDTPASSAFGLIAEALIGANYLRDFGRVPRVFFAASDRDFQDIAIGFGNQTLHLAFLALNNPGRVINMGGMAALSTLALRMRVPDLLTHEPSQKDPPDRAEFYEIKANSVVGRAKGGAKIRSLMRSYGDAGLPYVPGTVWDPNERIMIIDGFVLGLRVKAFFHYFRTRVR